MREPELRRIMAEMGVMRLEKSRGWLNGPCPLAPWTHAGGTDHSPSFGVKIEDNGISAYWCWSCKHHGRVSGLANLLGNLRNEDYRHIARQAFLADQVWDYGEYDRPRLEHEDPPEPLNENAYRDLYLPAWTILEAKTYLETRGVGQRACDLLELGYDPDDSRIVFPVRDISGRLFGFTGRTILSDEEFTEGSKGRPRGYPKVKDYFGLPKRWLLLGSQHVSLTERLPVFVVEGLMGLAHLFEIGADEEVQPVALMGSVLTEEKAQLLREWNLPVVLALDSDAGGDDGLWGPCNPLDGTRIGGGAVDALYQHLPVQVPEWPEGKDDPDQLTPEEVRWMVETTPVYRV